MNTTTRKQTPAQARKAALESDYTPFYAAAGLTKAVASTLQETATKASEQFTAWQGRSEKQAKSTADDLTKFVKSLPEQVKALPETTKKQVTEWQQQAAEFVSVANATYADLAGRGKLAVDGTIGSARQFGTKAEKKAADVASDVADKLDPTLEQVQEGATQVRKNVTGRTATETVTPRSAQKATATRAAKKTPAKKAPAAKKTPAAKKAPAKKATSPAS